MLKQIPIYMCNGTLTKLHEVITSVCCHASFTKAVKNSHKFFILLQHRQDLSEIIPKLHKSFQLSMEAIACDSTENFLYFYMVGSLT